MLPEDKCPYFKAKGVHLFVGSKHGDVCHGCGLAGKEMTMNTAAYEFISMVLKKLGNRVEDLAAERDALKRERDELRTIIESAGRVLAGKEKNE